MSTDKPRVGVIGTGLMGKPMARNLLKAGYPLFVHNRTASKLADLVAGGAIAPGSPREVGANSDIVITMVMDWVDTQRVALHGPDSAIEGMRPGSLFIDMGTTSPAHAQELQAAFAAKGVDVLDAPVSGGEQGAIDGTLTIMAGGSQAAFDRAFPVFRVLGSNAIRIGDSGAGQIAKACNQLIVASTIEIVAEAFALARSFGVDPALVRQALLGGFATSRILDAHGSRMLERNFVPGGAIKSHLKDKENIEAAAAATGLELPVAKIVFDRIQTIVDRGDGELDHTVLYTLFDT